MEQGEEMEQGEGGGERRGKRDREAMIYILEFSNFNFDTAGGFYTQLGTSKVHASSLLPFHSPFSLLSPFLSSSPHTLVLGS